jgi:hypothetical protein
MQWVTAADSPGVKHQERQAFQSLLPSAEVKNAEATRIHIYLHSPIHLHSVILNELNPGTILHFCHLIA